MVNPLQQRQAKNEACLAQPAQRPAPPSSCWGLWWELFAASPRLLLLLAPGLGCANLVMVFAK